MYFFGSDPSFSNASKFLWKVAFGYHYPFGKNTFQTLCLLELPFQFGNESFYSHLAFKYVRINIFIEEMSKMFFQSSFIENFFSRTFEGILLNWKLEFLQKIMLLTLKAYQT